MRSLVPAIFLLALTISGCSDDAFTDSNPQSVSADDTSLSSESRQSARPANNESYINKAEDNYDGTGTTKDDVSLATGCGPAHSPSATPCFIFFGRWPQNSYPSARANQTTPVTYRAQIGGNWNADVYIFVDDIQIYKTKVSNPPDMYFTVYLSRGDHQIKIRVKNNVIGIGRSSELTIFEHVYDYESTATPTNVGADTSSKFPIITWNAVSDATLYTIKASNNPTEQYSATNSFIDFAYYNDIHYQQSAVVQSATECVAGIYGDTVILNSYRVASRSRGTMTNGAFSAPIYLCAYFLN